MISNPGQAEFETGEQFAEVIVNFAGDADALLFAGDLKASSQRAQLFPRFPGFGFGVFQFQVPLFEFGYEAGVVLLHEGQLLARAWGVCLPGSERDT